MAPLLVDEAVGDVRVAHRAGQPHAVPGQNAHGVLEIVADLGHRLRLEHRPQVVERLCVTRIVSRERHEGRRVRRCGEGDADDPGALGIRPRALQVDRHSVPREQPGGQLPPFRRGGGHPVVVGGVADGCHAARCRGVVAGVPEQPLLEQPELQPVEDGDGRIEIGVEPREAVQVHVHRHVQVDGREALGQERLFRVLLDPFALLALEVARVRDQLLDRPEPRQELLRGLVADARDAGDVVDRVSHQCQHVDHLRHVGDAPALSHLGRSQDRRRAAGRAADPIERGAVGDELRQVLVGGHQPRVEAGRLRPRGDGADDVVGLRAGPRDLRDAQRLGDGVHVAERVQHLLRSLLPLRLVLAVLVMAAVAAGGVEHHRHVRGLLLLDDLDQRVGVAERGRRVDPARGQARIGEEDEIGLIDDRHAVDQEQPPVVVHAVRLLPRPVPSQLCRCGSSRRPRTSRACRAARRPSPTNPCT